MRAAEAATKRRMRLSWWLLAALAPVVGCGDRPQLAPAGGRVAYQGQPLRFGTVMFQHESGGQPSQGEIQPDGTFSLSTYQPGDGARIGPNRVSIFAYESQDPQYKAKPSAGEPSLGRLLIPRRYTMFGSSGLKVDVAAEKNEPFAFELENR